MSENSAVLSGGENKTFPLITFHQPPSWFHCGLGAPKCVNKLL